MSDQEHSGAGGPATVLLLAGGDPAYRGYAFEALATRYRLVLADAAATAWHRERASDVLDVPPGDVAAIVAAARERELRVDAVVTYNEFCVPAAAEVARALGARCWSPEAALACRDKQEMRRALADAGVPSARYAAVRGLEEARKAASGIGYPVVVKPAALAGSIGVVRADDEAGLDAAFAASSGSGHAAYGAGDGRLLVEEYLDGPEVSVESVVSGGEVTIVAVNRKQLGPAPYFEEVGHVCAPREPVPGADAIADVVRAAHAALGVEVGVTHTELRLTASGPRIVEVALRPAGDLIPLLVRLTTGVDLTHAMTAAVLGEPWTPSEPVSRAAAVRFFLPENDVRVAEVALDLPDGAAEWLHAHHWEVGPGEELRLPPRGFMSRLGYAVVTGEDVASCAARSEALAGAVRVVGEAI